MSWSEYFPGPEATVNSPAAFALLLLINIDADGTKFTPASTHECNQSNRGGLKWSIRLWAMMQRQQQYIFRI
jgi:hypothetical protein